MLVFYFIVINVLFYRSSNSGLFCCFLFCKTRKQTKNKALSTIWERWGEKHVNFRWVSSLLVSCGASSEQIKFTHVFLHLLPHYYYYYHQCPVPAMETLHYFSLVGGCFVPGAALVPPLGMTSWRKWRIWMMLSHSLRHSTRRRPATVSQTRSLRKCLAAGTPWTLTIARLV